jgi:hypothetical protein
MRPLRSIEAIVGLGLAVVSLRSIARGGEERNIRALARHLGCSIEDARRLYVAARRDGYGVAYRQVFPRDLDVRPPQPSLVNLHDVRERAPDERVRP